MDQSATFRLAYRDLEAKMRTLAQDDGDVFLPNPEPTRPVEHVLICMEPSLRAWAVDPEDAREKVQGGFRNFLHSMEDFLLHHAVREFLCRPGETYHITDVSKGAMLVNNAQMDRRKRYEGWYPLLQEEVQLVAKPKANIIAVGRRVFDLLERRKFPQPVTRILHYSGQAARARNAAIRGRESAFEAFAGKITHAQVLDSAREVLRQARVPSPLQAKTISRLERYPLTPSRKKLLFSYKLAFDALRNL